MFFANVSSACPSNCKQTRVLWAASMPRQNYVTEVDIGIADGTVTNTTKQGGIVSVYYLGCIVGCFLGGWAADRIGRINGLFFSAIFACIGGALQAATQSADFIIIARVVTGLGTGGK